jgi:prophage regulatory protein
MSKDVQEAIEKARQVAEGHDCIGERPSQVDIDGDEAWKPPSGFPSDGLVRLVQILRPLGPLPIGKSTWWAGVKAGRYPKPVKLGPRITCWRARDIIALIEQTNLDGAHS